MERELARKKFREMHLLVKKNLILYGYLHFAPFLA